MDTNEIDASPAKAFFVDMLTRDIGVVDCILDLVDNSVDKAVRGRQIDVNQFLVEEAAAIPAISAEIRLRIEPALFEITDTSGGISIADARDEVFRFGSASGDETKAGLSVYGIGMKRAMFKLGRQITMESATSDEQFTVRIDVDAWLKKPTDWHFAFDSTSSLPPEADVPRGTTIRITELGESAKIRFGQTSFFEDLRYRLGATYALFLKAGLQIFVNDVQVSQELPRLALDPVQPLRRNYSERDVSVLVVAGLTVRDDRTARGWYVFCNGRMVVEADKTSLTGWGDKFPQYHSKYNHFVGFLYFRSDNLEALPWTTTKQGVNRESLIYQRALAYAQTEARPVIAFLNKLYPGDVPAEDRAVEREVLAQAQSVSIDKLDKKESKFAVNLSVRPRKTNVTIAFKKPIALLDEVKRHIGHREWSASRLGEYAFDYFVEKEVRV